MSATSHDLERPVFLCPIYFPLTQFLYFLTKGWRSWQPRCWKLCLGGGLFWCTVAFVGVGRGWRQSVLITVNIFWVAEGRRNRSRKYMWSLFALGYHFDWWHQEMEDQDGYWDDSIWGKILRRRGHNLLSQTKFEHSNGVDSGLVVPIAEKIWPMERRYCSMLRFCMGFSWRQVPTWRNWMIYCIPLISVGFHI